MLRGRARSNSDDDSEHVGKTACSGRPVVPNNSKLLSSLFGELMQRLTGRLLLFLCSTGLAFPQTPHENLNAVVWVQTAAEYRASALQTYRAAEMNMIRAIEDKTWTAALEQKRPAPDLPLAVILDLDETVLDNSAFQARVTATGGVFSNETWQKWVE